MGNWGGGRADPKKGLGGTGGDTSIISLCYFGLCKGPPRNRCMRGVVTNPGRSREGSETTVVSRGNGSFSCGKLKKGDFADERLLEGNRSSVLRR